MIAVSTLKLGHTSLRHLNFKDPLCSLVICPLLGILLSHRHCNHMATAQYSSVALVRKDQPYG